MGGTYFSPDEAVEAQKIIARCIGKTRARDIFEWDKFREAGKIFDSIIAGLTRPVDIVLDEAEKELEKLKLGFSEDERLAYEANEYHDFLMHLSWSFLPDELKKNIKEPAAGCGKFRDSLELWMDKCRDTGSRRMENTLDRSYAKLYGVFDEYADKTWRKKPVMIIKQGKKEPLKFG
jgi:hypothetical protein